MPKFRKKPVVIEAQCLGDGNSDHLAEWSGGHAMPSGVVIIPTLEGDHRADIGDWIIQGVKGEFYPCKPDIFAATYELVGD